MGIQGIGIEIEEDYCSKAKNQFLQGSLWDLLPEEALKQELPEDLREHRVVCYQPSLTGCGT